MPRFAVRGSCWYTVKILISLLKMFPAYFTDWNFTFREKKNLWIVTNVQCLVRRGRMIKIQELFILVYMCSLIATVWLNCSSGIAKEGRGSEMENVWEPSKTDTGYIGFFCNCLKWNFPCIKSQQIHVYGTLNEWIKASRPPNP